MVLLVLLTSDIEVRANYGCSIPSFAVPFHVFGGSSSHAFVGSLNDLCMIQSGMVEVIV